MSMNPRKVSLRWFSKVDEQQPATRLQNASRFASEGGSRRLGQMVQHERAHQDVTLPVSEWKLLSISADECDFDIRSFGLMTCTVDHLSRCVDARHPSRHSNSALCGYGKCPGPARNIKHGFSRIERRKAKHGIAEPALATEG